MIYLSRLILNPRSRSVRNELTDPYEMHRTICKAFPEGVFKVDRREGVATGILFRVDMPRSGIPTLLVQSQQKPDWREIAAPEKNYLVDESYLSFGTENPAWKEVDFSQKLRTRQQLAFLLRANPTKRFSSGKGNKPGKRVGLYKEDEQKEWLEKKLKHQNAAKLISVQVANETDLRGKLFAEREKEKRMKFLSVQFEGILEVIDPVSLANMVEAGIGSGKGLGFGLLSLAPVRG